MRFFTAILKDRLYNTNFVFTIEKTYKKVSCLFFKLQSSYFAERLKVVKFCTLVHSRQELIVVIDQRLCMYQASEGIILMNQ